MGAMRMWLVATAVSGAVHAVAVESAAASPDTIARTSSAYFTAVFPDLPAPRAGVGAAIMQAAPVVQNIDASSSAAVSVGKLGSHSIDFGWRVSPVVFGDAQPHLFSDAYIAGGSCPDAACGLVQVSTDKQVGMPVVPGEVHRYEIKQVGQDWWLYYDDEGIGYYPQSVWSGQFAQGDVVSWYGEVLGRPETCTQMGNGIYGGTAGAATFDDLHTIAPDGTAVFPQVNTQVSTWITQEVFYDLGDFTTTGFSFGGGGKCTAPPGVYPNSGGCDAGSGGAGSLAAGALALIVLCRGRRRRQAAS